MDSLKEIAELKRFGRIKKDRLLDNSDIFISGPFVVARETQLSGSIGVGGLFNRKEAHKGRKLSWEMIFEKFVLCVSSCFIS